MLPPEWRLAVAHALQHQALPRLGAYLCGGCSYLPLGMKSYELPTPKYVPPPLPKLARTVCRTVGSKVCQLQLVEKTIRHLISPLSALERKACSDKKTKCLQSKNVSAPAHICKLTLSIPSRQNKPNQVTPNSPQKKGSHNPNFFSFFFLIKQLNRESISKLRGYNQEWNSNLDVHDRSKSGLT